MKKIIIIGYLGLVLYSIYHIVFNFMNGNVLMDIFAFQVDPLIISVFNLLGLFPLALIMFAYSTNKLKPIDYVPLLLGFVLGGFASTPYFIYKEKPNMKYFKWFKEISIVGIIMTTITILIGLINGNFQNYGDAFLNDSFVHIMTIDFLFLVLISPLLLKPVSRYYILGLIPIIGIFLTIFIEHYRLEKEAL